MTMQRKTRQRSAIVELLQQRNYHPTAEEIHEAVKQKVHSISLGTVYRNLEQLVEEDLVIRIDGPGAARYEGRHEDHLHLHCLSCGEIVDLWPSGDVINRDTLPQDFQVCDYDLLLYGCCNRCAATQKEAVPTKTVMATVQ